MGFFSGSETIVSASTVNLITTTPSTISTAIITSVLGGTNLVNEMQTAILSSMSNKLTNVMNYSENSFYYGMPTFNLTYLNYIEPAVVQDTLRDALNDSSIVVTYVTSIKGSVLTAAIDQMYVDYGYDVDLGTFAKPWAEPTRYGKMVPSGTEGVDQFIEVYQEYPVSDFKLYNIEKIDDNTVKITGVYITENVGYYEKTLSEYFSTEITTSVPISSIVLENIYYYAIYYKTDLEGNTVEDTWIYNTALGTYDFSVTSDEFLDNPFIPIVPLRWNNEDLTKESLQTGEPYLTSKKLLDILDVDILDLTEGLAESENNSDIDHAYVTFALSLDEIIDSDKRPDGMVEYFIDFFVYADTELVTHVPATGYTLWGKSFNVHPATNYLKITNSQYKYEIKYTSMEHNYIEGSIGSIGDTTVVAVAGGKTLNTALTISDTFSVSDWMNSDEQYIYVPPSLTLQVQLSEGIYEELIIYNLEHVMEFSNESITTNMEDVVNGDTNFIVPLSVPHLQRLTFHKREAVLYYSFKMVIQSFEEIDTGFFGSTFFGLLSFTVSTVLFLATLPAGGVGGFAAMAATEVVVAIVDILINIAIGLVIAEVAKLIIKVVGGDLALALAAFLTVVLAVSGTLSTQGLQEFFETTLAKNLLLATDSITKAITEVSTEDIGELEIKSEELNTEYEARLESFESIQSELSMEDSLLDPFTLLNMTSTGNSLLTDNIQPISVYETPTEFIDRTIHSGNVGVLSLDMISSYVEIALQPDNQIG